MARRTVTHQKRELKVALDHIVEEAVQKAVESAGQPKALSDRLLQWLDQLAEGRTTLQNRDDVGKHIEVILKATKVAEDD